MLSGPPTAPRRAPRGLLHSLGAAARAGACVLLSALAACGGGAGPTTPETPGARPVARVEVSPKALLFTAAGQQQRLSVQAFDDQGTPVPLAAGSTQWQASRAEQVAVDADGSVQARVALGSGQVVAVVGGVRSAPVLVSVAQPAAGVLLVDDAQIVGLPQAVDTSAEPDLDAPYDVVLSGVAAPAPGSLLLGREGLVIGGEVLESQAVPGGVRVRLRNVAIERLMQTAEIQEEIDLRGLPLEPSPELAALYDIRRDGDEYVFTPKPGAAAAPSADGRRQAQAVRKVKLFGFDCDLATPDLPLSMSQPAQFSMKFEPSYVVDYTRASGLRRLLLRADASFKMKATLQLNASVLSNLTCEATLYNRLVPLPGWAGLLLAADLRAGAGFEAEGSITVPLLGAEISAEVKGRLENGIDCTSGTCVLVHSYEPVVTNTLRFITPNGALANARSEFFLFGYGFAKMRAGLTLVDKARIDAVSVRAGAKFETSLAPEATQLAPVDPGLPDYRSDYRLHLLAEATAGSFNGGDTGLRKLLQRLGVFKVSLLKAQYTLPLGVSPKGSATVDKQNFADGDTLKFQVRIDPATATMPLLGYNVRRVRILRTAEGLLPREVAVLDATADQTSFDLSWVAQGTAGESGIAFVAFVDTVLPTPASLELATAQVLPGTLRGRMRVTESSFAPFPVTPVVGANNLGSSERIVIDADVEHDGGFTLFTVAQNSSYEGDLKRQLLTPAGLPPPGCGFVQTEELTSAWAGTTSTAHGENSTLELDNAKGTWRFYDAKVSVPQNGLLTTRYFRTILRGDCSGLPPVPDSVTTAFDPNALSTQVVTLTDPKTAQPQTGAITRAADGTREIKFNGGFTITSGAGFRTVSVELDLKEGPATRGSTDLAVSLIAPAQVAPGGLLTYAVNLVNRGLSAAHEVRAEFTLADGWTLLGNTGWSGCSVAGSNVTCRAATLEPGEQRAFLVDVQAPQASGSFVMRARVSAAELDTDFGNNAAEGTTVIAVPEV